jgi:hypothetical protein
VTWPGFVTGEYLVTGRSRYREHAPNETFVATIDENAERRAIQRGSIALLRRIKPQVPPGYVLPDGWLNNEQEEHNA